MSEQEAIAYIEEWDVTEAAKVLKWYEEHELLRPCDCDTIVAIETEYLQVENAKLRELVRVFYHCTTSGVCDECPVNGGGAVHLMPDTICDTMHDRMRELGVDA